MSNTKRKFVESHWLTFAMKGAISVVAGLCLMFAPQNDLTLLTQIVGWTMFGLAFVELLNVVYRKRRSHNWGFPLFLGAVELLVAVLLLFALDPNQGNPDDLVWLRILYLSIFVIFASVITIIMGFASFTNMTNRFMWVINGMVGAVIGFMMLGGTNLGAAAHIVLFGTYLMVNGMTDLFYGIHSKDELVEARASRKTAKKGKK
ncbi:DUF308 domain-containing protein [Candidatus Saccharibacteria bacterium]|nr:DUF308 domain-containing protein [Candidatus Saccharibacteria bacterium]MBR3378287.1 DUF308 domain-containing protein [Candidatus Saccharibacteria bacterium]